MHPYLSLAIAIVSEVVATSALRAADGFSKLLPSVVVVIGYALAFVFLSLTLKSIPVGIAYAIWSGLGVVLISVVAYFVYGQALDAPALIGMALIVAGVLVLASWIGTIPNLQSALIERVFLLAGNLRCQCGGLFDWQLRQQN
eukprot:gene30664-34831_t